jgi:hypothetical protein
VCSRLDLRGNERRDYTGGARSHLDDNRHCEKRSDEAIQLRHRIGQQVWIASLRSQ